MWGGQTTPKRPKKKTKPKKKKKNWVMGVAYILSFCCLIGIENLRIML